MPRRHRPVLSLAVEEFGMITSPCADVSLNTSIVSISPVSPAAGNFEDSGKTWNRLRVVREQQGLTLRTVSRRTGNPVRQLRQEEDPHQDLPISTLHRWQKALEVPLAELVSEPGNQLSDVVGQRAKLVRVMKTALSVCENARDSASQRLGQMLCEQLLEIMPELAEQTAWPSVGSRRSQHELGRIAENPFSVDPGNLS